MYQLLTSTARPSAAQKRTLWDDVKKASLSANEISRVVHTNSHRHWSAGEDAQLVTRFTEVVTDVAGRGRTFAQASRAQRKQIIDTLAKEFHRSPIAVRIRAKAAGLIVSTAPTAVNTTPTTTVHVSAVADPTLAAIIAAMKANNIQVPTGMEQPQATIVAESAPSTVAVVQEVEVAPAPPTRQMTNSSLRSVYSA
mgnify:CR=1 FL=1